MNIDEYRHDLLEEIKADNAASGIGKTAAFASSIIRMMQDAEYLPEDYQGSFYMGEGKSHRRLRVDGYIYDKVDNSLLLFVVCYVDDDQVMTKTVANSYFKMVTFFIEEALFGNLQKNIEPSTAAADLVDILITERNNIQRYRLFLLTNVRRSLKLQSLPDLVIDKKTAECQIWDIERIFEVYCSTQTREPIKINFLEYVPQGIPCLEASATNNNIYKSYLGIIPGIVLADIYDKFGSRLLEGNVRSFLSSKRAVNKKIKETILKEPSMFFAYNNGIAATAINAEFQKNGYGLALKCVEDFQIINGGQTTASLSNTRFRDKADLTNVYIQFKLTLIGKMNIDQSEQLIRDISRSSNSQNKVSEADFFATHPFHIEMEKISRRIFAPATAGLQYETRWFYERARGQYLQEQMKMTRAQRAQFEKQHPRNQVITKTDFAKFRLSWEGRPDSVSKGAQTNFMKFADVISVAWEKNSAQFNERYFKETVAIAILFKGLEKLVGKQSWYNSYRANIVTYSLALFHQVLIEKFKGMEFDLIQIWNKQSIPDLLIPVFIQLTKDINIFITKSDRPVLNVTQWCKKELCWQKIKKEVTIELPDALIDFMLDKNSINVEKRNANKEQKFISATEALSHVVTIPGETWQRIAMDARNLKLVSNQKEWNALKIATKIPNSIPQDFQAIDLLNILQRLNDNGKTY